MWRKPMRKFYLAALGALLSAGTALPAIAQESQSNDPAAVAAQAADRPIGAATIIGRDGQTMGSVNLRDTPQGVIMRISIKGLPPGERGIHIHQNGECDPATGFESAGEHFNPTGAEHGYLNPKGPHAGDLPNQWVSDDGVLEATVLAPMVMMVNGENEDPSAERSVIASSKINTAIVVHAHADDYATSPSGDSGERIACGVIKLAPPLAG
jgi:Cu-Zn family superoxide dismutase